jgi:hypothetical protein
MQFQSNQIFLWLRIATMMIKEIGLNFFWSDWLIQTTKFDDYYWRIDGDILISGFENLIIEWNDFQLRRNIVCELKNEIDKMWFGNENAAATAVAAAAKVKAEDET